MAREINKPFTRTELKILIFNKVKRGMSYDEAKKQVDKEIELCKKNAKKSKDQENKENSKNKTFKEGFEKLKKSK